MLDPVLEIIGNAQGNPLVQSLLILHGLLGFSTLALIPFSVRWYRQRGLLRQSKSALAARVEQLTRQLAEQSDEIRGRETRTVLKEESLFVLDDLFPDDLSARHQLLHELKESWPHTLAIRSEWGDVKAYEGDSRLSIFMYRASRHLAYALCAEPNLGCAREIIIEPHAKHVIHAAWWKAWKTDPEFERDITHEWDIALKLLAIAAQRGETKNQDMMAAALICHSAFNPSPDDDFRIAAQAEKFINDIRGFDVPVEDGVNQAVEHFPNSLAAMLLLGRAQSSASELKQLIFEDDRIFTPLRQWVQLDIYKLPYEEAVGQTR